MKDALALEAVDGRNRACFADMKVGEAHKQFLGKHIISFRRRPSEIVQWHTGAWFNSHNERHNDRYIRSFAGFFGHCSVLVDSIILCAVYYVSDFKWSDPGKITWYLRFSIATNPCHACLEKNPIPGTPGHCCKAWPVTAKMGFTNPMTRHWKSRMFVHTSNCVDLARQSFILLAL